MLQVEHRFRFRVFALRRPKLAVARAVNEAFAGRAHFSCAVEDLGNEPQAGLYGCARRRQVAVSDDPPGRGGQQNAADFVRPWVGHQRTLHKAAAFSVGRPWGVCSRTFEVKRSLAARPASA